MYRADILLNWFVSTLICLVLVGCSQGESNVVSGNRDGILHMVAGAEPQSLDPHVLANTSDGLIARSLFEGLVTIDPYTLAIEPGVARAWTFSEDRRRITFQLNTAARWSNGDPVTARDFVYSFERALNPKMGFQNSMEFYPIKGAEAYNRGSTDDPKKLGLLAVDDYTLEISLENPTPYFLAILAGTAGLPVHAPTVEAFGGKYDRFTDWTRPGNLVGNGPFIMEHWRLQRHVSVKKNEHYWDADNVGLKGVVFHAIESELAEEKMFRAGQLHYTSFVPSAKLPLYRNLPGTPLREAPLLGTYFYMFNFHRPPVDDVRVRRALALAIDRRRLVDTLMYGSAIPSSALNPDNLIPGYDPPDLLDYDPQLARQLLAEAGYPNGEGWPGLELIYNTTEIHRQTAVAVQQMWKDELNIQVTLANQEWKVFLDTVLEKNFALARMGLVAPFLDPRALLDNFVSDSGMNNTGFSNARYDEILLAEAPRTIDPAERMALLKEAETILLEEVAVVPFYTYKSKHLIQPGVRGLPGNVRDQINFKYIRLDPNVGPYQYGD